SATSPDTRARLAREGRPGPRRHGWFGAASRTAPGPCVFGWRLRDRTRPRRPGSKVASSPPRRTAGTRELRTRSGLHVAARNYEAGQPPRGPERGAGREIEWKQQEARRPRGSPGTTWNG